ncbi:hypothetical protein TB15x_23085, partial [Xanthomonas perforans]|uniref:PLP-dependent transferase n=1 Tax=Xanthomonas perforans TaxID=442694 RepID=UPI00062D5384
YGGTYRLLARVLGPWGVKLRVVDMSDLDAVASAIEERAPRMVWVETPSNPMLRITDIAGLAALGHAAGAVVVVDNTFASPALQRPLSLGADVVVHSATKFLSGHGANLAGAVVDGGTFDWVASTRSYPSLTDTAIAGHASFVDAFGPRAFELSLRFGIANDTGPALSPLNGFLLQQGMETLSVRMRQHLATARTV